MAPRENKKEKDQKAAFNKAVQKALKQYHGDSFADSPLSHLNLYRQAQRQEPTTPRKATNQVLHDALTRLEQNHKQDSKLIQLRFMDLKAMSALASKFSVAESTTYALQRQAIQRLGDILQAMEAEAREQQMAALEQRLEPQSYEVLVGVEPHIESLLNIIRSPEAPWTIAIDGIGGIGKTSLANALMRQVVQLGIYDEIGWVSVRQQRFTVGGAISFIENPMMTGEQVVERLHQQLFPDALLSPDNKVKQMLRGLRKRLKQVPHLIVIDNLETVADLETLLPTIQTLTEPSKFILTSRKSLYNEPGIFHFSVPELDTGNALTLIRQIASINNLPELAASSNDELLPIVDTVGGNPLALRLVVGQCHIHPLNSILNDLKEARGQTADNLYTFIYRKAWDSLEELSQRVFLSTILIPPHGDDIDYLVKISKLAIDDVRWALNKLVTLNLVDARGGLQDRCYSIHGLTRTFLHEQVAKWSA
ncbi:MAG: hypothetical protein KDE50_04920 [Caldilineaceae bacterium]|nr:hypothetical protein [Caldilineaceae bacterium]